MYSMYSDFPAQSSTGDVNRESFRIVENVYHENHEALIHCVIKGMMVFCASFGTITGVLSEFDVLYDYATVFFLLLISSMVLSLIHMRRYLFNVGYIAVFIAFTVGVARYRMYVNSGFQALLNIVNETYGEHFLLLFTRESTEVIADRYQSVTAAAAFIGLFLAILINVALFQGIMDTFSLVFLTVLPLFLGIYIGRYPAFISVIFIFFSIFSAYLLGFNGHYHFVRPERNEESMEYSIVRFPMGKKLKRKPEQVKTGLFRKSDRIPDELETRRIFLFHKSDSRHMLGLCFIAACMAIFLGVMSSLMMTRSEAEALRPPEIKERADEYVKIFVQNGFSGLFNRYQATGGLSDGKLGGVSGVRPSYTPNLIATYVPYAYDTVYLRAFTGQYYSGDRFTPAVRNTEYVYSDHKENGREYKDYIKTAEAKMLASLMEEGDVPFMHGKMLLENVGAGSGHVFLPYYTDASPDDTGVFRDGTIGGNLAEISEEEADENDDNAMEISYVPFYAKDAGILSRNADDLNRYRTKEEQEYFEQYTGEVYENYLQIPEDLKDTLEAKKEEIGQFDGGVDSLVDKMTMYFYTNYRYSLSPGTTPYNEDFVGCFLNEQNEGYCAHFAAASTMLFRAYGIPARYCEGYIISRSAVSERAQSTEYDTGDFFEGESSLGELPVVSVEITDGEAHAWTEIFVDGFGWVEVDMTPPSDDSEQASYADFLSALSGIFGGAGAYGNEDDNSGISQGNEALNEFFSSFSPAGSPLVFAILVLILILLLLPVIRAVFLIIKDHIRVRKAYSNGKYDICVEAAYKKLVKRAERKSGERIKLPEEAVIRISELLNEKGMIVNDEIRARLDNMMELTEKIIFSPYMCDKKEADELLDEYGYFRKKI